MLARAPLFNRRHGCIIIFVTGARAVAQLGNCVVCISKLLMLSRLVIIGVAAGTVGCVSCARIWNRLGITLMAIKAVERLGVRPGIVRRFVLVIQRGSPSSRPVTVNTFNCRDKVVSGFARCLASIVTRAAIARNIGMIESCRQPRHGLVAVSTICCRRDVIGMLTGRFGAVVTAGACSGSLAVVHAHGRPRGCDMTTVATVGCCNVGRRLARRLGSVMAANTSAQRVDMRECRR